MKSNLENYLNFWEFNKQFFLIKKHDIIPNSVLVIINTGMLVVMGTFWCMTSSWIVLVLSGILIILYNYILIKELKLNKNRVKSNLIELKKLRKLLNDKNSVNLVFNFLISYIKDNQKYELEWLTCWLIKLEDNKLTEEDLYTFLSKNQYIFNILLENNKEMILCEKLELFMKKSKLEGLNNSLPKNKEKYLSML